MECQQYERALSILSAGLELAKKRKHPGFAKHFRELTRITKSYLTPPSAKRNKKPRLSPAGEGRIRCSFCGSKPTDTKVMVAGAKGFICDVCVSLCNEIIAKKSAAPQAAT